MILRLSGIAVARGGRRLAENVSLDLAPGDAAIVTGPNGAGKSSLLRIPAGLLRPAAGTVTVTGTRALLAEASALDGERPLRAALNLWATLDGTRDRVPAALEAVGLAALADLPVRLLSTGQRRRAGLARIVAGDAALWLLDEPANGLDTTALTLLEQLIARHRATGGAALIATHLPLGLADARTLAMGEPA